MNFNTMKKTAGSMALAGAFLITAGVGSITFAQDFRWRDHREDSRFERRQEGDGYHDGLDKGREDARTHRHFDPNGYKYFRDGAGEYREGFIRGYREGYRQVRERVEDNCVERRQEQDGYNDGFNRGREDARDHRRFDPNCSEHFRDGDGEYREGFRHGYAEGFRQYAASRRW
jgi:flagellar biosynthesis/type III secretory pathway protein FliH